MIQHHEGKVVPWTTKWSGEVPSKEETMVEVWWNDEDWGFEARWVEDPFNENRQRTNAVLWMREGINRTGEPLFNQINGQRQRAAMLHTRCRMCGESAWSDQKTTTFIVGPNEILWTGESHLTQAPPVCESCIDLVLDAHPYLREQGYEMYTVLEYWPWGVIGDVFKTTDDRMPGATNPVRGSTMESGSLVETETRDVRYRQFGNVIARLQVVELIKYVPYIHKEKS